MRLAPLLLIGILLMGIAVAYPDYGDSGTYTNEFLREPNYTINYSKLPLGARLAKVTLTLTKQLQQDIIISRMEQPFLPDSCPGGLALCYQRRQHSWTEPLPHGDNLTSVTTYILPDQRPKLISCIDTTCTRTAEDCFCPEMPKLQRVRNHTRACAATAHLCEAAPGIVVLCEGNLTSCQAQYGICGCGPYSMCGAKAVNSCINERYELFGCKGQMDQCLGKYLGCACGDLLMDLQKGCTASRHNCTLDGEQRLCVGEYAGCAQKYDTCSCGT